MRFNSSIRLKDRYWIGVIDLRREGVQERRVCMHIAEVLRFSHSSAGSGYDFGRRWNRQNWSGWSSHWSALFRRRTISNGVVHWLGRRFPRSNKYRQRRCSWWKRCGAFVNDGSRKYWHVKVVVVGSRLQLCFELPQRIEFCVSLARREVVVVNAVELRRDISGLSIEDKWNVSRMVRRMTHEDSDSRSVGPFVVGLLRL